MPGPLGSAQPACRYRSAVTSPTTRPSRRPVRRPSASSARRSSGRSVAVVLALVALAGCSSDKDVDATDADAGTPSPSVALTDVALLAPNGLAAGGGRSAVTFGAGRAEVTKALATVGDVETEEGTTCQGGPRTTLAAGSLHVLLDGDTFVGWWLDEIGDPQLTTTGGIGIGSNLGEISAGGGVSVRTGSRGPEFTAAGGLGGTLDGETSDATVTSLFAGDSCSGD